MSFTQEELNKIIAEECIKSAELYYGTDEIRAKMKLQAFEKHQKELDEHQKDLQIIQTNAFKKVYAKKVTLKVISILKEHKEKEDLTWYPYEKRHKHDYKEDYIVPGMSRETIQKHLGCPGKDSYDEIVGRNRYQSGYRDVLSVDCYRQIENQFDQILRILVDNNIIKCICCSTICYYMYCDKK